MPREKKRLFDSFAHGRTAVLERKDKGAGGSGDGDDPVDATHLLGEVKQLLTDHKAKQKTLEDEVKASGTASKETAAALAEVREKMGQMTAQLLEIAQRQSKAPDAGPAKTKSLGEMFTDSDSFKALQKGRKGNASITIKRADMEAKTTITTGTLPQPTSGVIMPQRVPGVFGPQLRQLRVRDLLPQGNTTSNAIDYVKELAFTNAAAPVAEAAAKPESALTFTVAVAPVRTIAHWIPATNQVLEDFVQLRGYIDNRLTYGLKLVEEQQLLSGDGTGQNILGIIPQATAYDTTKTQAGDTKIDVLRHAIGQARVAEFPVDGIVVNPVDWEAIELTKANTGEYIIGDPKGILPFTIWGRAVVETTAISAGQFLTGAFQMGAQIWDRDDVQIDVSTEHQDFFIKNMVAIRVEERLALTVYRPGAFIYGAY